MKRNNQPFFTRAVNKFISKNTYVLLALACCIFFLIAGTLTIIPDFKPSKTNGTALTFDEISLLPNGYYYQKYGQYFINPEHPPLVKDIAALPFWLLKAQPPAVNLIDKVKFEDQAQYVWGGNFLFGSGNPAEKLIVSARLTVLLVNSSLLFLLFLSIKKIWSQRAAFLSTLFITASQFSIAHASIVTLDFMPAVLSMLCLVWFAIWQQNFETKKPTLKAFFLAALFLALALAGKFSAILLVPTILGFGLLYGLITGAKLNRRKLEYFLLIGSILGLALLLISVFYAYHVRDMRASDVIAQLNISYPHGRWPDSGRIILEKISRIGVLGRGFSEFTHGLLMVNNRIYKGAMGVYFNGTFYGAEGAGIWYFPALYFAKLQLTYLVLSVIGFIASAIIFLKNGAQQIITKIIAQPSVALLFLYGLAFGGLATFSTLQIGLRHIFPTILAFALISGFILDFLITRFKLDRKKAFKFVYATVAAILIGNVVKSYPYFLSNYNILAGGTDEGYKLAVDSNYDWGQDIKLLAKWRQDNRIEKLYIDTFTNPYLPLEYYLGDEVTGYKIDKDAPLPAGSYLVVSATKYQHNKYKPLPSSNKYTRYDNSMIARVGKTLFIYKISD